MRYIEKKKECFQKFQKREIGREKTGGSDVAKNKKVEYTTKREIF